MFNLVNV